MAITYQRVNGEIVAVCETAGDFVEALKQDLPIVAPDELAAAFTFLDLPANGDPLPEPPSPEIWDEWASVSGAGVPPYWGRATSCTASRQSDAGRRA